jgi:predicted DNA-binding transcriptional regulator YafY
LVWCDENYYLVAHDGGDDQVKNFRVDKMQGVAMSTERRAENESVKSFNASDYSKKIFGMYGGREELVTMEFDESLAGVVIDRFGSDILFQKTERGFRVTLRVMVSPTFFAWVLGFGAKVEIVSPQSVRDELLSNLRKMAERYES